MPVSETTQREVLPPAGPATPEQYEYFNSLQYDDDLAELGRMVQATERAYGAPDSRTIALVLVARAMITKSAHRIKETLDALVDKSRPELHDMLFRTPLTLRFTF